MVRVTVTTGQLQFDEVCRRAPASRDAEGGTPYLPRLPRDRELLVEARRLTTARGFAPPPAGDPGARDAAGVIPAEVPR
jgi:hypothetical protein